MSEADKPNWSDSEFRQKAIDVLRHCIDLNNENQRILAREQGRIDAVVSDDAHESVRRAAGHVSLRISRLLKLERARALDLEEHLSAAELTPTILDAIKKIDADRGGKRRLGDFIHLFESQNERVEGEGDLVAAVDAVVYAASVDQTKRVQQAVGAMKDILRGVARLQKLGLSVSEIQGTVDDYISQKKKHDLRHDFVLLGPVLSDDNTKGTTRNKRVAAKNREALLEQDEWVLRFLNDFWCRFWRSSFELSMPEEIAAHIERAREVIPGILEAEGPLHSVDLMHQVERRLGEQEKRSRVRLRDEHIIAAIDYLVSVSRIVEIEGDEARYCSPAHAKEAKLAIVPPRLRLVPLDDSED